MFEYKNLEWLSEVNDFGDDYHKPTPEETSGIDSDLLRSVKGLKRRYRDYGEFCQAMTILREYMGRLKLIYGGKKRLKMMIALRAVKEYVPFKPKLRHTKKNMYYIKNKGLYVDETRVQSSKIDSVEEIDYGSSNVINEFSCGKEDKSAKKWFKTDINRERVAADLETIEDYYRKTERKPSKMSKKAYKRRLKALRKKEEKPLSAKERLKHYYEMKYRGLEEDYDPKKTVYYKGTTLTTNEVEELETRDRLRAFGIKISADMLSKKSRKVVKRAKKAKKKAKKKDKKRIKLGNRYLSQFGEGQYSSFEEFESTMKNVIGKSIRG